MFGTLLATEPNDLKEELTVRCVEYREVLLDENSRHTPYSSTSITPAFNLTFFSVNRVVSLLYSSALDPSFDRWHNVKVSRW